MKLRQLAWLLAGCCLPTGWAQAQTAATSEEQRAAEPPQNPDDIIVTARKRAESVNDVPLSITVLTQDFLDRANINSVADLALQTPGFSFREAFGRTGGGRPAIRGMSSILGGANAAFFVDGVYVSGNITSYQLDNLERVEVIKGPQSALFGRSTFAGAINFITRRPTNRLQGRVKLGLAQYDQREAAGYISGPIVRDKLLFELDARSFKFGGDYRNADNGRRDIGAQRSNHVGGRILLAPSSNFEADLRLGYARDTDKGYGYAFFGSRNLNCYPPTVVRLIGATPVSSSRARGYYCGEIRTPDRLAYNNDELAALGYDGLSRYYFRSSLAMTLRTDSGWALTSISALNRTASIVGQDNTLLPSIAPSLTISRNALKDRSQEIRVQSPQESSLRALAGAYFYDEDTRTGYNFDIPTRTKRRFGSGDAVRNRALFALFEWDASSRLTLSAEGRYQWETVKDTQEIAGAASGLPSIPINPREAKYEGFLPRVTARFELTPQVNIYASAALGNKPGGFNNFPSDAQLADIESFRARGFGTYDEEKAWSYELGSRGRLGRMNFGVAGFYIDWSGQQLTRSEPYTRLNNTLNSAPFLINSGKTRIKGIEAELAGNPLSWLYLRLGYSYTDARFRRFYDETTEEIYDTDGRPARLPNRQPNPANTDGDGGDVAGNRVPQTPAHKFNLSLEASQPVSSAFELFARADLGYESKRYVQVDNLAWAGDSTNLNLSTGVEGKSWRLSFWLENALDDETPAVVTRLVDFSRALFVPNTLAAGNRLTFFRDFTISAPRRRQAGVTLTQRF